VKESQFDRFLRGQELIESPVPGFQLPEMNADPVVPMPVGQKAAASTVADEVSLQPTGQAMFAGGSNQAIGDQYKRSVDERDCFGFAQMGFENRPQTELCEQGSDGEYGSPHGDFEDLGVRRWRIGIIAVAAQESSKLGKDLSEHVLATQVSDGALLDLAVFAIGFDGAHVLVNCAAGGPDFDGSEVHVVKYHDTARENQANKYEICRIS